MNTITSPKGPIFVRSAAIEDAAAFRELRLQALREHPIAFTADYDANQARPPEFWVERLRGQGQTGNIYFAEHAGALVGMTGIETSESPKTRHSAWIWGVYTLPEYRGLRLVDALIETCIEWGRAHGVMVVKLGVTTTNAAALGAYLRCGFSVYGVEPQAVVYDGKVYDELLMARKV
jgi:ribosomal protein S18 acetylase RimI-like enzyme